MAIQLACGVGGEAKTCGFVNRIDTTIDGPTPVFAIPPQHPEPQAPTRIGAQKEPAIFPRT